MRRASASIIEYNATVQGAELAALYAAIVSP